jgi:hypothetical protein
MTENRKTKEDLLLEKAKVDDEVTRLKKVIEASNDETFQIVMDDLKEQIKAEIDKEEFSNAKSLLSNVTSFKNAQNYITEQGKLLSKKQAESASLEEQIANWQPSLFDQCPETLFSIAGKAIPTGLKTKYREINVGDVFELHGDYMVVKISSEITDKFAIISNFFDGEKMLQYPKNFAYLENTVFVGNIYDEERNEKTKTAIETITKYLTRSHSEAKNDDKEE